MKEFICYLFGHKWKFNFMSIPDKSICARCKTKAVFDPHKLEWNPVNGFECGRTDDELIRKWVS